MGSAKSCSECQGAAPRAPGRSRGRGAGRPGEAAFPALGSRSPAAAGTEGGPGGARRRTLCRCPPFPLRCRGYPQSAGAGHLPRLADTLATLPHQPRETGQRRAGAFTPPAVRDVLDLGVFLDGCRPLFLPPFACPVECPSASHSLSVSDSVSFPPWLPPPSGSPCFSFIHLPAFLGMSLCACYSVSSAGLSVSPHFLPFDAYLSQPFSPALPRPPEHQLPDPEAPWPGEHTLIYLLGTFRYRDLPAGR